MDALRSAPLTASGMIELQHGEIELRTLPNARLRMHSSREASTSVFETEVRAWMSLAPPPRATFSRPFLSHRRTHRRPTRRGSRP